MCPVAPCSALNKRCKTNQALSGAGETRWQAGEPHFATAEEAALRVARSPEGQAAARRAASAVPQLSEEEGKGTVPPMPPGAFVKEEDMPSDAVVKEEGVVPPMPPDAYVKVEVVVKEEERSDRRPKRQRTK